MILSPTIISVPGNGFSGWAVNSFSPAALPVQPIKSNALTSQLTAIIARNIRGSTFIAPEIFRLDCGLAQ
jgi:hypothetical protein